MQQKCNKNATKIDALARPSSIASGRSLTGFLLHFLLKCKKGGNFCIFLSKVAEKEGETRGERGENEEKRGEKRGKRGEKEGKTDLTQPLSHTD